MPQNIGYSDKYAAFSFLKMVVEESGVEEKLEEVKDKLKTFSRTYFQIGQNWQSIGERLAAPFQAAAKVFADFDDQMRHVAAVTGAIGKGGRNNGGPWWSTLHGARRIILTY